MSQVATGQLATTERKALAKLDFWTIFAFIFPFTQLVKINIGGTVYLQDVMAVATIVIFAVQSDIAERVSRIGTFLILLGLWLAWQIATDVFRQTPFEDYSRGWVKIVMFGMQVVALWLFLPRRRSYMVAFALGAGLTAMLSTRSLEPPYDVVPWKFGLGYGVGLFLAALGCGWIPWTRRWRLFSGFLLFAVAPILVLKDCRSLFGIIALAGGYCFLAIAIETRPEFRAKMNKTLFTAIVAGGIIVSQGLIEIYGYLASNGELGADAEFKYRNQTTADISLLQAGRSESLVSTIAIKDSPIFGHGSWAKDMYYVRLLRHKLKELGIKVGGDIYSDLGLIPTHSYFFGAWVEAGLMGGVFWLYVAACIAIMTYKLLKLAEPLMPLVIFSGLNLVWNVFFSPFGAEARFSSAFEIALLFWVLDRAGGTGVRHWFTVNLNFR